LKEVEQILEEVLNRETRDVPSVQELLGIIDKDQDIKRKLKCWIHRNLYPHTKVREHFKHNINPEISTEIETTIENTIEEMQSSAFERTEKLVKIQERREIMEKKVSSYKTLTEGLTSPVSDSVLDTEKISGMVSAKLKRREVSSTTSELWNEDIVLTSTPTREENVVDEVFPVKKRKLTPLFRDQHHASTTPTPPVTTTPTTTTGATTPLENPTTPSDNKQ